MLLLPPAVLCLYVLARPEAPAVKLDIKEVLLDEAKALIAAGALVLDVRERAAYETRHIAGALLAPLDSLAAVAAGSLAYAKTMPIVVYCGDGSTLGPRGTDKLNKVGYAGAVNLKPGIAGWAAAGLPIETGKGKVA